MKSFQTYQNSIAFDCSWPKNVERVFWECSVFFSSWKKSWKHVYCEIFSNNNISNERYKSLLWQILAMSNWSLFMFELCRCITSKAYTVCEGNWYICTVTCLLFPCLHKKMETLKAHNNAQKNTKKSMRLIHLLCKTKHVLHESSIELNGNHD